MRAWFFWEINRFFYTTFCVIFRRNYCHYKCRINNRIYLLRWWMCPNGSKWKKLFKFIGVYKWSKFVYKPMYAARRYIKQLRVLFLSGRGASAMSLIFNCFKSGCNFMCAAAGRQSAWERSDILCFWLFYIFFLNDII